MDPIVAVGLASAVVQFVDFGSKLLINTIRIYRSETGPDSDVLDPTRISDDLQSLKVRIESGLNRPRTKDDDQLVGIGSQCVQTSNELAQILSRFKGRYRTWNSFRSALKILWKKDEIEALQQKLSDYREQLMAHILVDLRQQILRMSSDQSEQFVLFDLRTQDFIKSVIEQRNVFQETVNAQIDELKESQYVSTNRLIGEHDRTQTLLVAETALIQNMSHKDHEVTRAKTEANVITQATWLRQEMEKDRRQIEALINSIGRQSSQLSRKDVEQNNALHASWYAKDIMYTDIVSKLDVRKVTEILQMLTMSRLDGGITHAQTLQPTIEMNAANSTDSNRHEFSSFPLPSSELADQVRIIDQDELEKGLWHLGLNHFPRHELPISLQIALANRFTKAQIMDWEYEMKLALNSVEPFFFVGAFLFPAMVRLRLNGFSLRKIAESMTPAYLYGYDLLAVRHGAFPALTSGDNSVNAVRGMLMFGLPDSQRQNLHAFQADMFDIRFEYVRVLLENLDSMKVRARCYVWNRNRHDLLPQHQHTWSVSEFMKTNFYQGLAQTVAVEEELLESQFSSTTTPTILPTPTLVTEQSLRIIRKARMSCEHCFQSFRSALWETHVRENHGTGSLKCTQDDCLYHELGFADVQDLERHSFLVHETSDTGIRGCKDFEPDEVERILGPEHKRILVRKFISINQERINEQYFSTSGNELDYRIASPWYWSKVVPKCLFDNNEGHRILLQMVLHLDTTAHHDPDCLIGGYDVHVRHCCLAARRGLGLGHR